MEELKNKEEVNTGERKLSYEELESNFYQMAEKLNTVYKERQILINQLNSTNNTVTRLNFLFKVIEFGNKFNQEFVENCVNEIEEILTISQEDNDTNTVNINTGEGTEKN